MTEKPSKAQKNMEIIGSKSAPVKSKKTKENDEDLKQDKSKPKRASNSKSVPKPSKKELMEIK